MQGGHRLVRLLALLMVAASLITASPALANDRVTELTKVLSSSSDKARLSAVAALARLEDRSTMKPLVGAMKDSNPQVRALAAAALGRLGHKAALPSLKSAATDDADRTVRDRAKEAAIAVAKANRLPPPWPKSDQVVTRPQARKYGGRAGFGRQAHAVELRPDLYVAINSTADDSPGRTDKKARKIHGDILRQTLTDAFQSTPAVTTTAKDAARWGLEARNIDLSVTKLDVAQSGQFIEVEAQLRLAISDRAGRMTSFLSGGAKIQVPKKTFQAKYLPNLRREALENAMRGMYQKLLTHLRTNSRS